MGQVRLVSDESPEAEGILARIGRKYPIRAGDHPTHYVVDVPGLDDREARASVLELVGDFPYGPAPVSVRYPDPPPSQ